MIDVIRNMMGGSKTRDSALRPLFPERKMQSILRYWHSERSRLSTINDIKKINIDHGKGYEVWMNRIAP